MSENEANWINVMGLGSNLQLVIDAWAGLVDTDELRVVAPPRLLPISPILAEAVEAGADVVRTGQIDHAPGIGAALLAHLEREIPAQLKLGDDDVVLLAGFYLEPAGGNSTT